jgi:hypothetical protein
VKNNTNPVLLLFERDVGTGVGERLLNIAQPRVVVVCWLQCGDGQCFEGGTKKVDCNTTPSHNWWRIDSYACTHA